MLKKNIYTFFKRLSKEIPNPETELNYTNNFTLLLAVVLSAQMTDTGVNKVTKKLFRLANSPKKILKLGETKIRNLIKSVNFIVLFRKPEPLQAYTFPTRVVEVLGFGKVVVLNDFGDLSKYFVDGENSILFSTKIEELNSDKIINVNNNECYIKLATNGELLLQNDFCASIQAKKILSLV